MGKIHKAMEKYEVISKADTGVEILANRWNRLNGNKESSLMPILNCFNERSIPTTCNAYHFTSTSEGEGTSTVVVNIAQLLSRGSNASVLFIDGNLKNPSFQDAFNLPRSPGLTEVLNHRAPLNQGVRKIGGSLVCVLPTGDTNCGKHTTFEMTAVSELMRILRSKFTYIIIDSPPLLTSSIALMWANLADLSFMVIQANRTNWEVAQKAKNLLTRNNRKIGGVILNQVSHPIPNWLYKRL
jgi:capsular exopolysaccharide synthesis family protein